MGSKKRAEGVGCVVGLCFSWFRFFFLRCSRVRPRTSWCRSGLRLQFSFAVPTRVVGTLARLLYTGWNRRCHDLLR